MTQRANLIAHLGMLKAQHDNCGQTDASAILGEVMDYLLAAPEEQATALLREVAEFHRFDGRPVISDCLLRSPGEELRRAADHADAADDLHRRVIAYLRSQPQHDVKEKS